MIKANSYAQALDLLASREADLVEYLGRVFTRRDYLVSCGYDRAARFGFLDEYKREVLGAY